MHLECLIELHAGLPQQGPGSDESTLRALSMIPSTTEIREILDVGCGSGRQSIALAQATNAHITAVDVIPDFLAAGSQRARSAGLVNRIDWKSESMTQLPLPKESVDVLWSEGALYNIGFESALRHFRPALRTPGWAAVSEMTWLGIQRPTRAAEFWASAYPDMADADENKRRAHSAGFRILDCFPLPTQDFWIGYYDINRSRLPSLREKWADVPEALEQLRESEREIALYEHFEDAYGYVFYIFETA